MLKVAFTLSSNINQSVYCTLDWVLSSQSDSEWVLYQHHWKFPVHEKIILMLRCLIWTKLFKISFTHNSIIRHISCRSSNASCSLISFLWWSWFMMAISFLITCFSAAFRTSTNLATKKRPVDRSIHLYTIPNDPLKRLQKNFYRKWSGNANCSSQISINIG